MKIKKNIYEPLSAALFAVVILILSIIPTDISGEPPSFYFPGMDKIIHATMYTILTFLILHMYLKRKTIKISTFLFWVVAILAYSVLMELIQLYFIDYRSGDIKDVYANLLGIFLGLSLFFVFRKIKS